LIDGPSLKVRAVIRGLDEPRYAAADRRGRFVYMTDSARGELAVVDVVRAEFVTRLGVGGRARHVSLSPSGRQLWVALGSKARELVVVDVAVPRRPRLLARLRSPFLAHDVGFAATGNGVWITSGEGGQIAVYDVRTREISIPIVGDAAPQHVTFSGGRAYVTSGDSGTLRVHDLVTGRLLRTTPLPLGSYNVQQGWGVVLSPSLSRGTLCVARRDGRLLHQVRVARSSHDACFVMSR
jgi:DNA-binding beta-propeller fold protein YncE